MAPRHWDTRFADSSQGRIIALLRQAPRTIDELATSLGLTGNAVRGHIAALERDGMVHPAGVRPSGGKPAQTFQVTDEAETVLSKAYAPALTALLGVLGERMTEAELATLLREVGNRLAQGRTPGRGDRASRVVTAREALASLGGATDVVEEDGELTLKGHGCPLAQAVRARPETCHAVAALVATLVGEPVRQECQHGERPSCRFRIGAKRRKGA